MSGRRRNELNSNDDGGNSSPPPSYDEVYHNEQQSMMSQIDLNENNPVPMPVRPNSTTTVSQHSGHSSSTTSQGPNIFTSYDDAHPHDNIYATNPSSNRPSNRPPISNPHGPSTGQNGSQGQPRLPWVYPQGYFCKKCRNTGTKIKNGKSCKDCWKRFAPIYNSARPDATILMGYVPFAQNTFQPGYQQTMYMSGYGPPQPPPSQQPVSKPMIVQPGDPRLGGILCGECRGSGRLKNFLDWKLCPSCNGVGRVRC